MQKYLIIMLATFALSSCNDIATKENIVAGTEYLESIEDFPLPEGFTINDDMVIFDTPDGKVVEGSADGYADEDTVVSFYDNTLPQLGWKKDTYFYKEGTDLQFEREGEKLHLNLKRNENDLTIKFSLSPK